MTAHTSLHLMNAADAARIKSDAQPDGWASVSLDVEGVHLTLSERGGAEALAGLLERMASAVRLAHATGAAMTVEVRP